jgi:hypothetical protein
MFVLQIAVKAMANTGLTEREVYYVGHLLGETTWPWGGVYSVSLANFKRRIGWRATIEPAERYRQGWSWRRSFITVADARYSRSNRPHSNNLQAAAQGSRRQQNSSFDNIENRYRYST